MSNRANGEADRSCSYCSKVAPRTKEHLWPAALHRRLAAAWNLPDEKNFWLSRLRRDLPSEPVIRDVCAQCNNGVLSTLDGYICELFDQYFCHVPHKGDKVHFRYDYHRLVRWLLKMSYNSARVNNGFDTFVLERLRSYILGESTTDGDWLRVFLLVSHPVRIPKADLPADVASQAVYVPEINRVGHMAFRCTLGEKILRAVHLRAYSFFIAFFDRDASIDLREITTQLFLAQTKRAVLLSPTRQNLYLQPAHHAWDAFKAARGEVIITTKNETA